MGAAADGAVLNGSIYFILECESAFDYGRQRGTWRYTGDGYGEAEVVPPGGEPPVRLTTDLNLGFEGPRAIARHRLQAGEQVFCALSWGDGSPPQTFGEAHQRLARTGDFWHGWISRGNFPDHPVAQVPAALRADAQGADLRAHRGPAAAAATSSLPETPGGDRNYDYRYTWLRDSTFMLWGLYTLGFDAEANDFFYFLTDLAEQDADLQIMPFSGSSSRWASPPRAICSRSGSHDRVAQTVVGERCRHRGRVPFGVCPRMAGGCAHQFRQAEDPHRLSHSDWKELMALSKYARERIDPTDVIPNFTADSAKPMREGMLKVSATKLVESPHTMISKPLTDSGPSRG